MAGPIDTANPPIVQGFHGGHWGGWTFEVKSAYQTNTTGTDSLELTFSKGGFQEARGSNKGAESFVEVNPQDPRTPSYQYAFRCY
jgi:hypothetical protein